MLELAVLGILQESPMHGYELRKQLATKLGTFRAAISYGSLYPTLRRLQAAGWITEGEPRPATADEVPAMTSRRGRVVYKITAEGKERFQELLAQAGPETFEDPAFGVHFAFFARTDQADPAAHPRGPPAPGRGASRRPAGGARPRGGATRRVHLELQRHGMEACEREVRWLEELIATERSGRPRTPAPTATSGCSRDTPTPSAGEPGAAVTE